MSGTLNPTPAPALQPSAHKTITPGNYISNFDFLNQYLPDFKEKYVSRYGSQSIAQFLELTGAEMPSDSDLIKWAEDGRLHIKYAAVTLVYGGGNDTAVLTITDPGITACSYAVGQTVFISSNSNNTSDKAIITAVSGLTFTVAYYAAAGGTVSAADQVSVFVYGSEYKKGSQGIDGSLDADPIIKDVSPIIIRDVYLVNGSDMAQIGWVQNEMGGYYWFLESKHKTRLRFNDKLEMAMVEGKVAETGSGAIAATGDIGNKGTRGFFESINADGNVWGGGNPSTLNDFDTMLKRLDKQGAIASNMLWLNRDFDLDIDDMLASQNAALTGGLSYGVFDNDENMALNLGFTGFKRGGYEFYKQSWKYLNDITLRGGIVGGKVNGVLVPTGGTNVYDQVLGQEMARPYLHVRYRSSQFEDRRYKSWITGGAGGAQTNRTDAMYVDFLSERALCTLASNNFFIFQG